MSTHDHLDRVEIRRFRGLSDLDLDRLGRFNVLLGANDVGKTSVLEALFLLTGFVNLKIPLQVQRWRNLPIDRFAPFEALFHEFDPDRPIDLVGHSAGDVVCRSLKISAPYTEIDIDADSPASTGSGDGSSQNPGSVRAAVHQSSSLMSAGPRLLRYDATVQPREGEPVLFSATLRVDGGLQLKNLGEPAGYPMISARYMTPRVGYDASVIGELIVRKQADRLVPFLTVINPRIKGVAASGDTAYLDLGLDRMVPLDVFGSGMIRAASILSHCMLGNERILLVDELENGLHHAAVRPLLETLLVLSGDQNVQVFATTHSVAVLQSLLDALDNDRFAQHRSTTHCYTLQRDHEGHVRPYRYEHEQFEHCVRHGIEIR